MADERIACINCGEIIADRNGTSSPEVARLYKLNLALGRRVAELERIITRSRQEFRKGGDPVDSRAWLFRVEIDESLYTEQEPNSDGMGQQPTTIPADGKDADEIGPDDSRSDSDAGFPNQ